MRIVYMLCGIYTPPHEHFLTNGLTQKVINNLQHLQDTAEQENISWIQ
jgi:hypothetical protein